jgi:hypothetical protein
LNGACEKCMLCVVKKRISKNMVFLEHWRVEIKILYQWYFWKKQDPKNYRTFGEIVGFNDIYSSKINDTIKFVKDHLIWTTYLPESMSGIFGHEKIKTGPRSNK